MAEQDALYSSKNSKNPSERKGTKQMMDSGECLGRVFAYFDENGDGRVSPAELQRGVRAAGGELTAEEAEMAVRLSDSDGDGLLGPEDFARMMEEEGAAAVAAREEELLGAFKMYVGEGGSEITPRSLKNMMRRLGEAADTEKCRAMITMFDVNGDGVLDFEEFKTMMMMQGQA
ncbi:unnamed protein product [Cuscuta campestris]|uniref:EF-hand domain-containing protein n=1 Tax=Cuscuta campestris TaxID=132261 RepID=A0A484L5D7_9ASTE|nr:unnamed protein product [Cuscuta campestris]